MEMILCMKTINFHDSFGRLCSYVNRGNNWEDMPNSIYYFGCTKNGIENTFDLHRISKEKQTYILDQLSIAEQEGRVFWREHIDSSSHENIPRFIFMIQRVRAMGIEVKLSNEEILHEAMNAGNYCQFWHNLPNMRDWIEKNINNISFSCR